MRAFLFPEVELRRKWGLLLATTILVVVLPGFVNATWKNVKLANGYGCQDTDSGAVITYPDLPYKDSANVTKSCNVLTRGLDWLRHSAAAAVIRTHTMTNPDGTQDTVYPQDSKPPAIPTFTWSCDSQLAIIASQTVGTATSINVDSCASGTGVSGATYSFVRSDGVTACSADWSISGSYPNRLLVNAGSNAGSGNCELKAHVAGNDTFSALYAWAYVSAAADSTAPNPVTGMTCTSASTTTITCTFDSTVDPADGVATSGVKVYHFYRNGSILTGQDLTAVSPGMVDDFTAGAIGTASGTASITLGTKCALSGDGGAGIEGAADNINVCSVPLSGSSFDIITRVSALPNVATYNKALLEFRSTLSADSVANNCTGVNIAGTLYTESRNRHTTAGTRTSSGQFATAVSGSLPMYLHAHIDSSGLDCDYSFDGGAWTNTVTNFSLAALPGSSLYAIVGTTATQAATSISTTFDFVTVNNVGRLTKTLTVPAGDATYTVRAEDNSNNISTALAGWTGGPSTPTSSAIKFQPGWYGLYNQHCTTLASQSQCRTSYILNIIATEICNNSNLVGMKLDGTPAFFIPDTANVGNYNGNSNQGFGAVDQILAALRSCGKFLILQGTYGFADWGGEVSPIVPTFTYSAADCVGRTNITCAQGTATSGTYGFTAATQYGTDTGEIIKIYNTDWHNLAIAATQAYCARYDSDPAFYSINMLYWGNSIPVAAGTYNQNTFNSNAFAYLDAARAACPTTNVHFLTDFPGPSNPASSSSYLAKYQSMHGAMANSDTDDSMSWGQAVYTGSTGSPSVIDYRGVVRYFEEVESVEMCGYHGSHTPATLFNIMQNGITGNRPRWPSHIVVAMSTECDPTYGWEAWKTFINSISGEVMNARDSTLRTPASVKSSWCESSMTCP